MLLGQGEFRLVEAIVDRLRQEDTLVNLTNHLGDNRFHIAAAFPESQSALPFLSVRVLETAPQHSGAPHTGWRRSSVELCAFSTDELASVYIIDYVERMVMGDLSTSEPNRRYLNFSNAHINNAMTTYITRRGVMLTDLQDVWESSIKIELIWIDKPCEDACDHCLPDTSCDDDFDCSSNC
jgi:hypothetical protein